MAGPVDTPWPGLSAVDTRPHQAPGNTGNIGNIGPHFDQTAADYLHQPSLNAMLSTSYSERQLKHAYIFHMASSQGGLIVMDCTKYLIHP